MALFVMTGWRHNMIKTFTCTFALLAALTLMSCDGNAPPADDVGTDDAIDTSNIDTTTPEVVDDTNTNETAVDTVTPEVDGDTTEVENDVEVRDPSVEELDAWLSGGEVTFVVLNRSDRTVYLDMSWALTNVLTAHRHPQDEWIALWTPGCMESCDSFDDGCHGCLACEYMPAVKALGPGEQMELTWEGQTWFEIDQVCDCGCYWERPTVPQSYRVGVCAHESFDCMMDECIADITGVIDGAEPTGTRTCFEATFEHTPADQQIMLAIELEEPCGDPELRQAYPDCIQAQDEESCVAAGGAWGPVGLYPEPVCQCPTGQGDCRCTRQTDCLSACIAEFTGGMFECEGVVEGRCSPVSLTLGCFCWIDENGEAMGICAD